MSFRVQSLYDRSYWTEGKPWWSAWSRDITKARTFPSFEEAERISRLECCADPHDYAIVSEESLSQPVVMRDAEVRVS